MKKQIRWSLSFLLTLILGTQARGQCDISYLDHSVSTKEACVGAEIDFSLWTYLSNDVSWNFGDGTTSSEAFASKAFSANGTYYVTGTLSLTCGKDTTVYDTILIKSNPRFMWDTQLAFMNNICPNEEVSISLYNWEREGNTTWNLGDGSAVKVNDWYSVEHIYSSVGSYPLSAVVVDGCGTKDTIYDTLTVVQKSSFDPNIYLGIYPDTICPGEKVYPSANSAGISDSLKWSTSDGQTAQGPSPFFTFPTLGAYTISVTAKDGCGNDTLVSAAVVAANTGSFKGSLYLDIPDSICPGDEFSVWAAENLKTASYDFGDGTTVTYDGSDIDHAYAQAGIYTVKYIGVDYCGNSDTVSQQIVVNNTLNRLALDVHLPDSVCPNDEFLLAFEGNTDSLVWNLGDGTITEASFFGTHSYSTQGWKQVTLTGTNGCGFSKSINDSVLVGTNVKADGSAFTFDHAKTACLGDSISITSFLLLQNIQVYFGDGNAGTFTKSEIQFVEDDMTLDVGLSTHLYASAGTYSPFVVATNNCGNVDTVSTDHTITIGTAHSADVSIGALSDDEDDIVSCNNKSIDFILEGASNYEVNFGDGVTESFTGSDVAFRSHSYADSGAYKVVLIGTNSCGGRDTSEMQVYVEQCSTSSATAKLRSIDFTMVPNPTTGAVQLLVQNNLNYLYEVFNAQGQIVASGTANGNMMLDLTDQSAGNYFVQLVSEEWVSTGQLVIVK